MRVPRGHVGRAFSPRGLSTTCSSPSCQLLLAETKAIGSDATRKQRELILKKSALAPSVFFKFVNFPSKLVQCLTRIREGVFNKTQLKIYLVVLI